MSRPRCRIMLFGQLTVKQGGRTITRFRTHKTAALLAYLAFHCRCMHPRSVLIDVLWRDARIDAGRQSLSTALSWLRRQLEPLGVAPGTVIVADRFSVGVSPEAVSTDVADFESSLSAAERATTRRERMQHLRTAVELYKGDLLPGFHEDWVPGESVRLCEEFVSAVVRLTALLWEDESLAAITALARRAVRADPLREEPYRELMRAYEAMGEPETALRKYEELATILWCELNERPSARTRRLAHEMEQLVGAREANSPPGSWRWSGRTRDFDHNRTTAAR